MALKRNYASGTKFYYVRVQHVNFAKDSRVSFRLDVFERDTADSELDTHKHFLDVTVRNDNADFATYFSIAKLDEVSKNIIGQCYEWTKAKVDQFRDFEDC